MTVTVNFGMIEIDFVCVLGVGMGLFDQLSKLGNKEEMPQGKVISILNQKGGVGKTTMTFNLAHALKEQGKKVLCLDMDPQSNLTLLFDPQGQNQKGDSIFNLLLNSIRELKTLHSESIPSDLINTKNGIDYINSSQDLSGFELTIAGIKAPRQLVLKNFIKKNRLAHLYDYILVDGPPTLGLIVVNILMASDGVIVPFQPDQFSRKGLFHFHEVVEEVEDMGIGNDPRILGYIPNLVDARRKQTQIEMEQIKSELTEATGNPDIQLFGPFPNKVQLVRASHEGKSVFDFKSKEFDEIQVKFREMADSVTHQFS